MYIKDTAINGNNLLDKIKANLIANNWELLVDRVQTTRELYFRNTNSLVIIGMKVVTDNVTYFNLILNNILTFNSANNFYNQSGSISTSGSSLSDFPVIGLSLVSPMSYHAFINDNRLILVANLSNVFNMGYVGKIDAVINPAQYANPILVAGHLNRKDGLTSVVNINNNAFMFNQSTVDPFAKIRLQDNTYSVITATEFSGNPTFYPKFNTGTDSTNYPAYFETNEVERISIFGVTEPLGYVDGVYRIFGNNFSTLSEFTIDSEIYIIFPNIFRTAQENYYAIKKV